MTKLGMHFRTAQIKGPVGQDQVETHLSAQQGQSTSQSGDQSCYSEPGNNMVSSLETSMSAVCRDAGQDVPPAFRRSQHERVYRDARAFN